MNKTQREIIAILHETDYFKIKDKEKRESRFYGDDILDLLPNNTMNQDDLALTYEFLENYIELEDKKKEAKKKRAIEKKLDLKVSAGNDRHDDHVETLSQSKYVLTCAQNNTDVDKTFFKSLLKYCEHNNCQLLIAKMPYNKNAFLQPIDQNELWYDPLVTPYLVDNQINLGGNFQFVANANVLPTAKNPVNGFENATSQGIHAIIPASKISLKPIAALKGDRVKNLISTGTCTKRNYILKKAGVTASDEHNIGAVFVDTESNEFRHLEQMQDFNGFYDLNKKYSSTKISSVDGHVAALQLGDIHAEKMEKINLQSALDLIDDLKPLNLIIHDLFDFSSRNHHNIKDCTFIHRQHVKNASVKNDIQTMSNVLDTLADALPADSVTHVIESNHDLAINTWLKNADFKIDPQNAVTYLTCMLALYEHQESSNEPFNMLEYVYEKIGQGETPKENLIFHKTDESVIIAKTQMGCHGHNGINGARGNPASFRKLGTPMNTGHTHSAGITGKVYTSGVTATLDMDYNKGASSWSIAHILTYENGQRQLIFS